MTSSTAVRWYFVAPLILAALGLYLVREALFPFVIAFGLAYLLDPLLDWMEKKKVPRTAAVLILIGSALALVFTACFLLYPLLERQLSSVIEQLPAYAKTLQDGLSPIIERLSGYDRSEVNDMIWKAVGKMGNLPLQIVDTLYGFAVSTVSSFAGLITTLFVLLVVPVATFYFMRDIDPMKEKLLSLVPPNYRGKVEEIFHDIDKTLSAFVRGQFTIAMVMAFCYSAGLYFIGTPMGLFIGILAGFANLVPYLALIVGFLPALILTYLEFHDFWHLLYVMLLFGGVQILEGFFLTPKLMGDSLGLHPVIIMMTILIGGIFFGIVGIILAVPVAAVAKVLFDHLNSAYRSSDFYKGGGTE